jgi:hypothetical protein
MKTEDAIKIMEQIAAKTVGTLADHQAIQQALQVIKEALKPKEEVKE